MLVFVFVLFLQIEVKLFGNCIFLFRIRFFLSMGSFQMISSHELFEA